MHDGALTAAGPREPTSRVKPIPPKVREALRLMVYGRFDDADCTPLDFIAAAKEAGIKPDQMRRYLDRPAVRTLLMQERRAFRAAVCAGNEGALLRVRETSKNGMCVVASIRALEQLDDNDVRKPPGGMAPPSPGIVIVIETPASAPSPSAPLIDLNPNE